MMNRPRIMYERREIEKNPLKREVLVHSAMYYKCEVCGTIFQFWLEKGLEDKKQDEINLQSHKPVPFCIGCLCGGTAEHIAWGSDIELDDYRPLSENENYFENKEDESCGVSHFRNKGNAKIIRPDLFFGERQEKKEEIFESKEDDPFGLAYISTSTLKAELRRRKRWK